MKRFITVSCLCICILAILLNSKNKKLAPTKIALDIKPKKGCDIQLSPDKNKTYDLLKKEIESTRINAKNLPPKDQKKQFESLLIDQLIPYWYSTR